MGHLAPHRWALSGACYWNECILFIYIRQTIKGLHASTTKPIRRGLSSGPIYIIILQYMRGGRATWLILFKTMISFTAYHCVCFYLAITEVSTFCVDSLVLHLLIYFVFSRSILYV